MFSVSIGLLESHTVDRKANRCNCTFSNDDYGPQLWTVTVIEDSLVGNYIHSFDG